MEWLRSMTSQHGLLNSCLLLDTLGDNFMLNKMIKHLHGVREWLVIYLIEYNILQQEVYKVQWNKLDLAGLVDLR